LKIQAEFTLEEGGDYLNIMNFSTGVLHFRINYKEGNNIIVFVIGFIILYLRKVLGSWFNAPATFVIPKYW
jgi:hypothetical protein